ncbi:MAG: hypothetical protein HKN48_08150 [Flavobacteriaceae bacterium]|nr:hypothetical protein [Flavobacteriaceae bacterium]
MIMNYLKKITGTLLLCFIAFSCAEDDNDLGFVNGVATPSNIALLVQLSQDNSGTATLTPSGESTSLFTLDFGDNSGTVEIIPGNSVSHIYSEGSYTATLIAENINGETTEFTQQVEVSFLPPENLVVTINRVAGDNFSIEVSAEADLAVGFEVLFGDVQDETPTPMMVDETITHTYPDVGEYQLTVTALSGGAETTSVTETVVIDNPIVLPIDFESETIEYVFEDFGGAINTVIDNPDASGVNTSSKVVEFFKEPGAETFAGTVISLGGPIDFSEFQAFKLDSWSPLAGSTVKLKLENANDPNISAEIDALTSTTNAWESIFFDFSSADLSQEYSKVIVFYDFGNAGNGDTFYYDNIEQTSVASTQIGLPLDFENANLNYQIIGFEGAESELEANPDPSGINTSDNVIRTTKTVGAQFFAGTAIPLDVPIDFSSTESISMKTWSPKANIPVRLKLENSSGDFVELDVNTTVTNQWEELTWSFTGMTGGIEFTQVVVFFEFVVDLPGDGTTYYFDDVELAISGIGLPLDFEDPIANYQIIGFEGADSALEANPDPTGVNTSSTVVRTTKAVGAQFFAGTAIPIDEPIVFSGTEQIKMKVWSPKLDIPVRLKLENGNGEFVELDVNTTVTNQWEELVWDFSGMNTTPAFDTVVVFFEFVVDLPGDGSTYYFDDIDYAN